MQITTYSRTIRGFMRVFKHLNEFSSTKNDIYKKHLYFITFDFEIKRNMFIIRKLLLHFSTDFYKGCFSGIREKFGQNTIYLSLLCTTRSETVFCKFDLEKKIGKISLMFKKRDQIPRYRTVGRLQVYII